jgi:ribosomal protein L23
MSDFYTLLKQEINTEKTQKLSEQHNIRTFICLPTVKKNDVMNAFKVTFGYDPEKINILTFAKRINNRRNRTTRVVKMKKAIIFLPKGKDLTPIKK